jgi:hypothetical protein
MRQTDATTRRVPAAWLWVLIPALASVSCMLHGPRDVERELSAAAGVELESDFGISLGRFGTWVARKVARSTDEVDFSLKGVKRVQVGVYQVAGLRRGYENVRPLTMDHFSDQWTPVVRVREPGEEVFVLTHQDDADRIRGLLVVVTDQDEWVIVRIKGKLDQVLEEAMRVAFSEVDRPDLYAATRRERGLDVEEVDIEDPADEVSVVRPESGDRIAAAPIE